MNEKFFKYVKISNFKSLKDLNIPCKRINLFIGYPNVGKSNIIEALSLFDMSINTGDFKLKEHCRYVQMYDLFYNQSIKVPILIETNKNISVLRSVKNKLNNSFIQFNIENENTILDSILKNVDNIDDYIQSFNNEQNEIVSLVGQISSNKNNYLISTLKKSATWLSVFNYKFKSNIYFNQLSDFDFLTTPFGNNLFSILFKSTKVKEMLTDYLNKYNFDLVYNSVTNEFKIQKKMDGIVYETPFSLIADTLQRITFYSVAIESNTDSILLFEEPEVNSFPPFIKDLANKIVESKSNQFFITTHSPYLLNTIIENGKGEVAVNIVDFKDHQSIVKQLSDEEIDELLSFDSDLFLNIDRYMQKLNLLF
jgi:AAA15 family ATPase/GTPase